MNFFRYLLRALQSADARLGATTTAQFQRLPVPMETVISTLIQDCFTLENDIVLVLDDYHTIYNDAIHQWMRRLIQYLPPQVHLVLLTRRHPALNQGQLHVRGLLAQVTAPDLAFTPEETRQYLQEHMERDAAEAEKLHRMTEGWPAGLQILGMVNAADDPLITLSVQSREHLTTYVIEQVLQQQTDQRREFLLRTSVLKRLHADLCTQVTSQPDAPQTLEALQAENLFIFAVGEAAGWWRYHHLFAEVLTERLRRTQPALLPELYRRAAMWCEANGWIAEAVDYALAVPDRLLALRFVGDHGHHLIWQHNEWTLVSRWLEQLAPQPSEPIPPDLHCDIELLRASIAAHAWQFDDCRRHLETARELLEFAAIDSQTRDYLHLRLDTLELIIPANNVATREDLQHAFARMEQVITGNLPTLASIALMRVAAMCYRVGAFDEAQGLYHRAIRAVAHQPNAHVAFESYATLILIARNAGDTRAALALCRDADEYAMRWHLSASSERVPVLLWQGLLQYDVGEFEEAAEVFRQVTSSSAAIPTVINGHFHLARTLYILGAYDEAVATLAYAGDLARRHQVQPILAALERVILWVDMRANNLSRVRGWLNKYEPQLTEMAASTRPNATEELFLLMAAHAHITLKEPEQALHLLNGLQSTTLARGRAVLIARLHTLQALALQAIDESEAAVAALAEAITQLKPSGLLMPIAEHGPLLLPLLAQSRTAPNGDTAFIDQLARLARLPLEQIEDQRVLSYREQEVLRLVGIGFSNREVADKLFLSEETVKTHMKRIFLKLEVNNRTQAVAVARQFGLL